MWCYSPNKCENHTSNPFITYWYLQKWKTIFQPWPPTTQDARPSPIIDMCVNSTNAIIFMYSYNVGWYSVTSCTCCYWNGFTEHPFVVVIIYRAACMRIKYSYRKLHTLLFHAITCVTCSLSLPVSEGFQVIQWQFWQSSVGNFCGTSPGGNRAFFFWNWCYDDC